MINYEAFQLLSIYLVRVVWLIALYWSYSTINRGRGWYHTIIRQADVSSQEFDWDFVEELFLKNLTFLFRLITIVNIIGLAIFNELVFGEEYGFWSSFMVVTALLFDGIKSLYNWTKGTSVSRAPSRTL